MHYRDSIHGLVKSAHPHRLPNGDIIGVAADFYPVLDSATAHLVGVHCCFRVPASWMDVQGRVILRVACAKSGHRQATAAPRLLVPSFPLALPHALRLLPSACCCRNCPR